MYLRIAWTVIVMAVVVQGAISAAEQQQSAVQAESANAEKLNLVQVGIADQAMAAGRALEAQNNLVGAADMFQGVVFAYQLELGDSPKLVEALGELGRVLTKQHKSDVARVTYARMLRLLIEHPELADSKTASIMDGMAKSMQDMNEPDIAGDATAYGAELRKQGGESSSPSGKPVMSDRLKQFAQNTVEKRGPQVAIDALYETVDSKPLETRRVVCDGKGRIREELTYYRDDSDADNSTPKTGPQTPQQAFLIVDFPKGTVITELGKLKAVVTNIVRTPMIHDKQSAAALNAKSVGEKEIMGHHCTGYEFKDPEVQMVVWVDNDVDFWVQRDITYPSGEKSIIRLKEWKLGAPDPKEFMLPAGFKTTAMPAVIPNCPY